MKIAREIWDYILSHHNPEDRDRCFSVNVLGKRWYLCARCSGWYLSFLIFWFLIPLDIGFLIEHSLVSLYLFPIPALIDWGLHRLGVWEGRNSTRFASGFLIGFTFAQLMYTFFRDPLNLHFWTATLIFVSVAAVIWKKGSRSLRALTSSESARRPGFGPARELGIRADREIRPPSGVGGAGGTRCSQRSRS